MKRAFTLLEILISVVVLAIGLVGVVAIFPAVIDLQRRAQDVVIGTAAATSAEAQLVGTFVENKSLDWIDWSDAYSTSNLDDIKRFPVVDILHRDVGISVRDARVPVGVSDYVYDFLWDASWEWDRQDNRDANDVLLNTGDLVLGGGVSTQVIYQNNKTLPTLKLSVGDRLMPDATSGSDPRYVYDMVVRRVDTGIGTVPRGDRRTYEKRISADRLGELPVEIAVFVRRVDRNIRVPLGVSIRESLTGVRDDPRDSAQIAARDRRLPLAVDPRDFARIIPNGKPGEQVYSKPIASLLRADTILQSNSANPAVWDLFDPTTLRHVANGTNTDSAAARLSQVGQMFVDNTGVVRTVTAIVRKQIDSVDRDLMQIDPPFPTNSLEEYRQIVFTPQPPVGIRVLTTR